MMLRSQFASAFLTAVAVLTFAGTAVAMNKAELVDAIASGSKLSKADAGRALDATIEALSVSLKKGDRVALVGFGTFSVSKRESQPGPDGLCEEVFEDAWEPAPTFARRIYPAGYEADFQGTILASRKGPGGAKIIVHIASGSLRVGEGVKLELGIDDGGGINSVDCVVLGILANGVPVDEAFGGIVQVSLRGIEKKDIKRGMVIIKSAYAPDQDPPLSPCESYVLDDGIAQAVASSTGLPLDSASAALEAMKSTIIDTLASGEAVQVEVLGDFYVQAQITLSATEPGSDLAKIPAGFVAKKSFGQLAGKK